MVKSSLLTASGRALLLSVAISTVGLSACVTVTPEQQAAYDQAIASLRTRDINAFLRNYPDSQLSASILNNLSSARLRR